MQQKYKNRQRDLVILAKNGFPLSGDHLYTFNCIRVRNRSKLCLMLKELRPDWFVGPTVGNAKQMAVIERAKKGMPAPDKESSLYYTWHYIKTQRATKRVAGNYNLRDYIQELRPDWFIPTNVKNKEKRILLALAKEQLDLPDGLPREAFKRYVSSNQLRDKNFVAKVLTYNRDWKKYTS